MEGSQRTDSAGRDLGEARHGIEEIARKIRGIRFAMFSTRGPDGRIESRPMTTQEAEFDGDLWFFTGAGQDLVAQVEADPEVSAAYVHPDQSLWVTLGGRASVLDDRAEIKSRWNPLLKAYFPGGPDDPELRLIRVEVDRAEYWDAPSNKGIRLLSMLRSAVTGRRDDQGEHEKINL